MHPLLHRPKATRGFTLIEILVVVTIIALLIAIIIPVTQKALANARLNAATSEIINLRQFASDAATDMGGTLPLTEGITALDQVVLVDISLGGGNETARLVNLNAVLSLDNVFMSMKPPMMDDFYQSPFGLTIAKSRVDPPLRYDKETRSYYAPIQGRTYTQLDGFGDSSRIECAPVQTAFRTTTSVNAAGGINFLLDGVNSLPAGRCVFMVYESVPMAEAYELSKRLNPAPLLNSQSFSRNSQTKGRVIYQTNTNTTRVYVYLANF